MPTSSFVTSKIGMDFILVTMRPTFAQVSLIQILVFHPFWFGCLLVLVDYCFVYLLNVLLVFLVVIGLLNYYYFG